METPTPAATVIHVADDQANGPEESLQRIAAIAAANKAPIRMRVAVQLWDADASQYVAWRGQIWKVEVVDTSEAKKTQQALELFFDLFAMLGAEKLEALMADCVRVTTHPDD